MNKPFSPPALPADMLSLDTPDEILIQGLVLPAFIGVFDPEYDAPQNVRFDIRIELASPPAEYRIDDVLRYDHVVADIRTIIAAGHIDLVETLAERVAAACLAHGPARLVDVRVTKPDAVAEAAGVGVRMTRRASH